MQIVNDLLSNDTDYLHALRNAQPLPQIPAPPVIIPQSIAAPSVGFKIKPIHVLIGIGVGFWAYLYIKDHWAKKRETKRKGSLC